MTCISPRSICVTAWWQITRNDGKKYGRRTIFQKILSNQQKISPFVINATWHILKNVVYLATEIFDNIRKLHGLGKRERLLLQIAVILHSCGSFVNMAQARENSYKIIMSTEIIGISHIERVMAANIVRYNNEYFPDYQDIDEEEITKDQYITIVKLCAILKLANVLDKSNHQRIQKVRMSLKENSLQITAYTLQDITLEKGYFTAKRMYLKKYSASVRY